MENQDYAGFIKRLAAYVIDTFIMYIPYLLISYIFMGNIFDTASTADAMISEDGMIDLSGMYKTMGLYFIVFFGYFAYFESSEKQATFGKQILKIKVTNIHGERISFMQALGRNLAKMISSLILFVGFIMAAFTGKKQGLHDMMASTLVLNSGPKKELNVDLV